jgi:hypothetical protein
MLWAAAGIVLLQGIGFFFMGRAGHVLRAHVRRAQRRPLYIVAEQLNLD